MRRLRILARRSRRTRRRRPLRRLRLRLRRRRRRAQRRVSWIRDQYRKRGLARYQPQSQRKWNNRERWRTARLVIRLVLAYSPRSIGTALIVAGLLIQQIDK